MDAADEYLEKSKPFIADENRHSFESVAEMFRNPMTFDQKRAQVIRHHAEADWVWTRPDEPIPQEIEDAIQAQIKAEGLDPTRPFDAEWDGGLLIPDTTR